MTKKVYKEAKSGQLKTSINTRVGGSDVAKQNVNDVILYDDKNQNIFNLFFSGYVPSDLLFVLFDEPNREPNDYYIPNPMPMESIDNETVFEVFDFTPKTKLTDGLYHNLLGIKYNNKNFKLKWKPKPRSHWRQAEIDNPREGKTAYFYIEDYPGVESGEYDQNGKPVIVPTKWWGTMVINQPNMTSFGKVKRNKSVNGLNSDIKYLLKI